MLANNAPTRIGDSAGTAWGGLKAVHHEPAQKHRQSRPRGKPKGKQRDETTAGRRIVGAFRRSNALDGAMAEPFRMLGYPLFNVVGNKSGHGRGTAG